MNKFLWALATVMIIMPTTTFANDEFKSGNNGGCFVDRNGNDKFWYCGQQSNKCGGVKYVKGNIQNFLQHGYGFSRYGGIQNQTSNTDADFYWCCNGTPGQPGYFVAAAGDFAKDFYKYSTETKVLDDGILTCKKTVVHDPCGNVTKHDCTTPDSCTTGYTFRNGECVTPCPDGQAFESANSNECISCPTTNHQGVVWPTGENTDGLPVCVKCDSDSLFDTTRATCKKKSDYTAVTASVMHKCFQCTTSDAYKSCVKSGGNPTGDVKSQCNL